MVSWRSFVCHLFFVVGVAASIPGGTTDGVCNATDKEKKVKGPSLMQFSFASHEKSTIHVDWSQGDHSWKDALALHSSKLWEEPNYCDNRAIRSSAPLTALFGLSTIWPEVSKRRGKESHKPLEIHVLGAAYPFEGRSDWSLLSAKRPRGVSKVRVVLVLGTPWQEDNVPKSKADEFDVDRSLLEISSHVHRAELGIHHARKRPQQGKVKDGRVFCTSKSAVVKSDKMFSKADLCKDHGNGLEVVCVEKYYQEVSSTLPSPDAVLLFSPGFPQLARRSWDQVLRGLLQTDVPIMVGDLLYAKNLHSIYSADPTAEPGAPFSVEPRSMEDGMTFSALDAYGARRLAAYRNPFPILITEAEEEDTVTAKNAVLQIFQGRRSDAATLEAPSTDEGRQALLDAVDFKKVIKDSELRPEVQAALLIHTSPAYDLSMMKLYFDEIRDQAEKVLKIQGGDEKLRTQVKKLGLLRKKPRREPWDLKDWLFILTELGAGNAQIF